MMQGSDADTGVLSTPGHLVSLAARGFTRLSEARLKPLGSGAGHLPVLVALQTGRADTQRDLARFARIQQPPMAQMLTRMERDGLIHRTPDPDDGRSSRVALTKRALARLPEAIATLFRGNRDAMAGLIAPPVIIQRHSARHIRTDSYSMFRVDRRAADAAAAILQVFLCIDQGISPA